MAFKNIELCFGGGFGPSVGKNALDMSQINYELQCFGLLTELIGEATLLESPENLSVEALKARLLQDHPQLAGIPIKVAQDNELLSDQHVLKPGKLSIFPPFSGG